MKKQVLIVKTGYSETLDPEESGIVSLGDVLRTTVILHLYPKEEYEVTWLTDKKCLSLLKGNPFIHRILVVDAFVSHLLLSETYDILVNLEKDLGICAMCENIKSWERYGYRTHRSFLTADSRSEQTLLISRDSEVKQAKEESWSQVLYKMLGKEYNNEPYTLGWKSSVPLRHKIGYNYLVGPKFPTKAWPDEKWKQLDEELGGIGCFQEGTTNLEDYFAWLDACDMIVTNDSLGLHIALALGKKIVALFGPTLDKEVHDTDGLIKIVSSTKDVKDISVEEVIEAIDRLRG